MYHNRLLIGLSTLIALTLLLAACAPQANTAPTQAVAPAPMETTAAQASSTETMPLPNTGPTAVPQAASQGPILTVKSNEILGDILADSKGMTLYVFTKDDPGVSNCYDDCAVKWPPLIVDQNTALDAGDSISAKLGTTQRKDGSLQLTVNDMPVYYWFQDQEEEDVYGQGVGGVWFVLDPAGNMIETPLTAPEQTAAPAATVAATTAPAANAPVIDLADNSGLGKILVDSQGMTLYTFAKDDPGVSNCYDQCAEKWPPLLVEQNAALQAGEGISATLATTERKDGTHQVTVNDMPVYYFFKDTKPGDASGQGVGDVWFVLDGEGNIVNSALGAAETSATAAVAATVIQVADNPGLGKILTDSQGMTVYAFTVDEPGVSNCYNDCAQKWPAVIVDENATLNAGEGANVTLGKAERKDGSYQLTVNDMPVYHWFQDAKPGDALGQGIGSVWFVLNQDGSLVQESPGSSSSSSSSNY